MHGIFGSYATNTCLGQKFDFGLLCWNARIGNPASDHEQESEGAIMRGDGIVSNIRARSRDHYLSHLRGLEDQDLIAWYAEW